MNVDKLSSFTIKDILKNINNSNYDINYKKCKEEERKEVNKICKLPYLITTRSDFFVASILISKPNFITEKKIISKIFF